MVRDTEKCVLKTDKGTFLTVRNFGRKDGLHLCAVEGQNEEQNAPIVDISRRVKDSVPQMAFQFRRADGSYSPKVEGNVLKVEKIVDITALTESHWFQKRQANGGLQYHLLSVAGPPKSLSLDGRNRFILSDYNAALITERVVA